MSRYKVQWTPAGWHVVDTLGDGSGSVAEYGLGSAEYGRAKELAATLNASPEPAQRGEAS